MSRPVLQPAPRVWIAASHRILSNEHGKPQRYTLVDEASWRTLVSLGLQPVSFPAVAPAQLESALRQVSGVLLGGSATHVHPSHFGGSQQVTDGTYDLERDAVSLPLVRLALRQQVPLIGFCRGSHEFNVACGGTLHQDLRARTDGVRHWEDAEESVAQQYLERHFVTVAPGGALERLVGMRRFPVSSLHSQGVDRLGEGLVAEAHADDGLVEAFRFGGHDGFAWGFQFHPEWGWRWHPAYGRIMQGFAEACRQRRAQQRCDQPQTCLS
ncbi:gamma-glutamyl-gamma-aminobutyrate hydrolase family protein [Ramlibacter sp. AW1]|uniref:Gamma-glutamyl-gamma-aminobutyrate hydrolase family protein n=1 Tax=Ramlibacter aurantiacus TaxID=2801330 RepID=A0A937D219_9BURK|nr:gamma-glutamyl-gamma-aminobutyrate hydrolase family protein [Ramlibacter aurantiacus]